MFRKRFLVVAAALCASLVIAASPVLAASRAHVPLYLSTGGICGASSTDGRGGSVNLVRDGDTVRVSYRVSGLAPSTNYTVSLWGTGCSFLINLADPATTDSHGHASGKGTFQTSVTGYDTFIVAIVNGSATPSQADTLYVSLP